MDVTQDDAASANGDTQTPAARGRPFNARRTFQRAVFAVIAALRVQSLLVGLKLDKIIADLKSQGVGMPHLKRLSTAFMAQTWGDVLVGKEEFMYAVEHELGWEGRPDVVECLFEGAQKIGGMVDARQFCMAMAFHLLESLEEGLRFLFWMFDRHKNGMLNMEEFADMMVVVLGTGAKVSAEAVEALFTIADANRNGYVSEEEFVSLAKRKEFIQKIIEIEKKGLLTIPRGSVLPEPVKVVIRRGGILFVRIDALFRSSWEPRYCEVSDGLFIVHRGQTPDRSASRHVDRALKIQGARLSKNVPYPVRLRLESQSDVLLLEAENAEIVDAWIMLFHNEGLECSPDPRQGGPPSPSPLVEKRKQSDSGITGNAFDFGPVVNVKAASKRLTKSTSASLQPTHRLSVPSMEVPLSPISSSSMGRLSPTIARRRRSVGVFEENAPSPVTRSKSMIRPPRPLSLGFPSSRSEDNS